MPILYFFLNGMLCLAFKGEAFCTVRTIVNNAALYALLGNAIMFILLSMQPLSLKQVTHLDISTSKLVVIGFYGLLLTLALGLHSQNESFDPVAPAVETMYVSPPKEVPIFKRLTTMCGALTGTNWSAHAFCCS